MFPSNPHISTRTGAIAVESLGPPTRGDEVSKEKVKKILTHYMNMRRALPAPALALAPDASRARAVPPRPSCYPGLNSHYQLRHCRFHDSNDSIHD